MNRTLQLTATVSAGVPPERYFGRELTDAEVEEFAREAADDVLRRCFQRCERVAVNITVNITATVTEGGQ
jgi:hypothetical protein